MKPENTHFPMPLAAAAPVAPALFALLALLASARAQSETRAYFERHVLASAARGALTPRDFTIVEPKLVPGDGFTDSEVVLRFARNDKALPVNVEFLAAVIHNVELAPPRGDGVWRLRRARCERAPGGGGAWLIKALVFGCRRDGADGQGELVPLPRGRSAVRAFVRDVVAKEPAGVRWRSLDIDMSGK